MTQRLFDIASSAMALIVFSLPLLVIIILIKMLDSGPVFYHQRRIGRGGNPFDLYKFRTMRKSSDSSLVTVTGDSRITPLGQILRRWKLDELPQLWNVLRGDMRIIGPRPEAEKLVQYYTPSQRQLLDYKPGLAGLSQLVFPHEADLLRVSKNPENFYLKHLMPKKIAVDLEYERQRTFWSDIFLLIEVLFFVLSGKTSRKDNTLTAAVIHRTESI